MYFELPLVLLAIIVAMLLVWKIDFSWPFGHTMSAKAAISKKEENAHFNATHPDWVTGKELFKENCAGCHNPKLNFVGPALIGVTARWDTAGTFKGKTGRQWLKIWIHNYNDVVAAGYKYGIDLANSRPAQMNVFPYLSDADIDKILLYVDSPDLNLTPAVATTNKSSPSPPRQ